MTEFVSNPNEAFETIKVPRKVIKDDIDSTYPFKMPDELNLYVIKEGRQIVNLYRDYYISCFKKGFDVEAIIYNASQLLDKTLSKIWDHFLFKKYNYLALVAVGGYGRNEQFLESDIDLLIVSKLDPIPDDAKKDIETFISFLWDLKLDLGVSVRTVKDSIIASHEDITIITNLIENHFITGSKDTYDSLINSILSDTFWNNEKYFDAKAKEQVERYHTYRDTVYSLEPDVKNNPGGLRDLHLMQWIALKVYKAKKSDTLESIGLLSRSEYKEYTECRKFLFDVRYALHCIANTNVLRLDLQKELASMLGYGNEGNTPVETMMRDLFRTFRRISELNNIVLQQTQLTIKGYVGETFDDAVFINTNFVQRGQYIDILDHELFKNDPSKIIELFYCIENRPQITAIHVNCIRALRDSIRELKRHLITDPECRRVFKNILSKVELAPRAFSLMHESRVLSCYMPQWERIEGLAQFDRFHLFSVDEHTIRVINNVVNLASQKDPIFTLYKKVYKKISEPKILLTAAFLHDIAKGRGGSHAQKGSKEAETFCRLHDFSDYETNLVSWLVGAHLQFNTTATRRDISDLAVINNFADFVQDEEHLNLLYCLTVSDMCATNDNVWTSWKDNIFKQLYSATLLALNSGSDDLIQSKTAQALECQNKVIELNRECDKTELLKYLRQFPSEYFIHYSADDILWHVRNILRFPYDDEPLVLFSQASNFGTELLLYYKSSYTKMFGSVVRTMALKQMNVFSAQVFLTHDYHALCTIMFQNKKGLPLDNDRLNGLRSAILSGISDHLQVLNLPKISKNIFDIPTTISYLDLESDKQTKLEISTLDRQGLLAKIGITLGNLDCLINAARITTTGERADDYFAITDLNGLPLDASKKESLSIALKEALDK